tara:strand:+ start:131 stop:415 length:285 start_codon:yes stop_codon:yes gene_type:complete
MAKEETKKTETVEAPKAATAQPTAPAQPDPMALSIGDLKGLASIIDVASTRGAFKAAELAGVGTLFNKLNSFLVNVEKQGGQPGAAGSEAPKEK